MRSMVMILVITVCAMADVEIVPLSTDSDVSFVSWVGEDEHSHLGRYEGDSLVAEITTAGDYDASVGVCEFSSDSHIVLYVASSHMAYCDTLWAFDPSALYPMYSAPMERFHENYHYSFLKNPDTRWDAFLVIYAYTCFSSMTSWQWKSLELDVSFSGEVDSLFWLSHFEYKDSGSAADMITVFSLLGPVCDGTDWPEFCTNVGEPGGPWPSWNGLWSIVHNPPADSTDLLYDGFYGAFDTLPDWPPTLMALGSCSDGALAIWEDAYGQVHCSGFDCISPVPVSTTAYPWPYPSEANSSAMSSNPDDSGMLLAWHQGGEIRCRHYEGEWNGFDHIVVSDVNDVDPQDIAVSSVDDGYWIAWLDSGDTSPELAFVDRSTVTAIGDDGSPHVVNDASLGLFPNPCRSILSIVPGGLAQSGPARVMIHDCSGRLVMEMAAEDLEWGLSWDCRDQDGQPCNVGVYFVTVTDGETSVVEKVLLLE